MTALCRAGWDQPGGSSQAVCSSYISGCLLRSATICRCQERPSSRSPDRGLFLISRFLQSQASGLGRIKELLVLMSPNTYHGGAHRVPSLLIPVHFHAHSYTCHRYTHTHPRGGREEVGMVLSGCDSESDCQLSRTNCPMGHSYGRLCWESGCTDRPLEGTHAGKQPPQPTFHVVFRLLT